MTDKEMREYFQTLAKILDAKHKQIPNLQIKNAPGWVIELIDEIKTQITRPTGLSLHGSSSAFEKEFLAFLRSWRSAQRNTGSPISPDIHIHYKMTAGIYLRQLSRLYKEIGT